MIGPKLCECGCGQPAPIAKKTDASKGRGRVRGQPQRFIRGHNPSSRPQQRPRPKPPASTKLCECGCGQPTPIAPKTSRRDGHIAGQPTRFISGHNASADGAARARAAKASRNPPSKPAEVKLCECGCGRPTPIAKETDSRRGVVRGQPHRYIRGHAGSAQARAAVRAPRAAQPGVDLPALRAVDSPTEMYAEELLHVTELLVGAVHDDGPDEVLAHVAAALRIKPPAGVDPVVALVTVLAAQIDPDTTAEQRLGWVRAFDRAAAQAPTPPRQLPVRASPRKETAA